jgi:hypothetical protein
MLARMAEYKYKGCLLIRNLKKTLKLDEETNQFISVNIRIKVYVK